MLCRFENRLSGQALELTEFSHRITAGSETELPTAFARIAAAQEQGLWTALLLDYELGEWLAPAFLSNTATGTGDDAGQQAPMPVRPSLTASLFAPPQHQPAGGTPHNTPDINPK